MNGLEDIGVLNEFEFTSLYGYRGVKFSRPIQAYREDDQGSVKYEQWHDGMCIIPWKGRKAKCWVPTVIMKTTKEGTVTTRTHAIGRWEKRESLTYIPICQSLDEREMKKNIEFIEYVN